CPDLLRVIAVKFRRAVKEFGQHVRRDAERELSAVLLTKADERQHSGEGATRDANNVPGVGGTGAELQRRADDASPAARDDVGKIADGQRVIASVFELRPDYADLRQFAINLGNQAVHLKPRADHAFSDLLAQAQRFQGHGAAPYAAVTFGQLVEPFNERGDSDRSRDLFRPGRQLWPLR